MQPSSVGWGKEKDNETLCGINLIIHYKGTIHENTKCEEGKEREGTAPVLAVANIMAADSQSSIPSSPTRGRPQNDSLWVRLIDATPRETLVTEREREAR
jgi:hypothetical protein